MTDKEPRAGTFKATVRTVDHAPAVYEVLLQDPNPLRGRSVNTKFLVGWEGLVALHGALSIIRRGLSESALVMELKEGTTRYERGEKEA